MNLTWLTVAARKSVTKTALGAVVLVAALASADTTPASANTRGDLLVTPAHARVGDVITVTVVDPDVATTVSVRSEETDFAGNLYVLPVGVAGEQTIFRVMHPPLADLDGDGEVDHRDITVTIPSATIAWVAAESGTFAILRQEPNDAPVTFLTSYRHSLVDTVIVKVSSPSDTAGFDLVLKETGAQTGVFSATFKTGPASLKANAADPEAVIRPVIKAVDGQLVNLEYADQSPLTLVTNSVLIDTTLPEVTIIAPEIGLATRNVSEYARVRVTDGGSGVEISEIRFHIDLDRDGVFDEPGEIVVADPSLSKAINKGWDAVALLPAVVTDGSVSWYVSATDRAGNVALSDANPAASGRQDHTFIVDTVPPYPVAAYLGSSYDEVGKVILTNQQKRLRVVFSENLDIDSVVPNRFLVGSGNVASDGVIHEDHPDTVWLTFDSLSSVVGLLTVLPGAVKDAPGFPSELHFLEPIDQLGPALQVVTDKAVTNGLITVDVTSEEMLGSPPSLTINGVTYSKMIELTPKAWTLTVDATTLTGAASGQGVKNLQVVGLDMAGNAARGGQSPEASTYPSAAILFEFDSAIKSPAVVPGNGDVASSSNPVIVVTYADEPAEYVGDTHGSVTIVSAKLDGFDVTSLMTAATSTSWIYQPSFLANGEHTFTVQGRDDAGNIHGAVTTTFFVDVPPPTPTPTPGPVPTPTVIPLEGPGQDAPANLQPGGSATPTAEAPGSTSTPEASATPSATAVAGEIPQPTGTPDRLTEADLQATVTAMRALDDEDEEQERRDAVLAADVGYTVFGCGLPAGNSVGAIGDYAFVGLGLLGLIAMRHRRRVSKWADSTKPD